MKQNFSPAVGYLHVFVLGTCKWFKVLQEGVRMLSLEYLAPIVSHTFSETRLSIPSENTYSVKKSTV